MSRAFLIGGLVGEVVQSSMSLCFQWEHGAILTGALIGLVGIAPMAVQIGRNLFEKLVEGAPMVEL